MSGWEQTFRVKVVGVTYRNKDGSDRQKIISNCKKGEIINLVREKNNSHDKNAIAVVSQNGNMIGYLPSDSRLADHIDKGGHVTAKIINIIGGPTILEKLFKMEGKSYGCVLEITKKDFDLKIVTPLIEQNREISKVIDEARSNEEKDPSKAIIKYQEAMDLIQKLDSEGDLAKAWRSTPVPINRISLILERQGLYQECIDIITWYEGYEDNRGLPTRDIDAIMKRKERAIKKISITPSVAKGK
jgi:hypothetical protein